MKQTLPKWWLRAKDRSQLVGAFCVLMVAAQPLYAGIGDLFRIGVPVEVIQAPLHPEPSLLKSVAILDFTGDDRTGLASALRDRLASADIMGKAVYAVSNRALMLSGSSDVSQIVAAAKQQNIDAVYFGDTEISTHTSPTFNETVCTKGGGFKKCKEEKEVVCRTYSGTYTATLRVLDVRRAEIIYEDRKDLLKEEKHCSHDSIQPPRPAELAEQAQAEILEAFVIDIIPRTEAQRIKVKNADKAIAKAYRAQFKEASAFVRKGRFDMGCGGWNNLYEFVDSAGRAPNQQSVALLFNLGLCSENQRDYELAREYYLAADRLLTKDDSKIRAALVRMEHAQRAIALLQQ